MFPQIPAKIIFDMFTKNAQKAMFLDNSFGALQRDENEHLLILKRKDTDPFENLFKVDMQDVLLQIYYGKPIYGNAEYLDLFDVDKSDYFFFDLQKDKKFVIGHPEKTIETIDYYLGYHKSFPFIPFT